MRVENTSSRSKSLAWVIFSLTLIFIVAGSIIYAQTARIDVGVRWGPRYFPLGPAPGFAIMALLIVVRQPKNRIGWLYGWIGVSIGLEWFLQNYADLSLLGGYGILPFGVFAAWIASWFWAPAAAPILTFLPLTYPDGRLLSPRRRLLAWLDFTGILAMALVVAFSAGPLTNFSYLDNPLGVINFNIHEESVYYSNWIYNFIQFLTLPLILLSILSAFQRLKRSTGIERQQLKWFTYACAGLFIGILGVALGSVLGGPFFVIGPFLMVLVMTVIPVLTGMAVLRYRLWGIDLIIRRTLQYTLLTGMLISIYLVIILLLQRLVTWASGENSNIVIVISTLVIAALFNPVRNRVQSFIDRHFYRSKYNAESILAEFASISRNEMDIDRLSKTIIQLANATIQPSQLSLWLKKSPGRRDRSP